MPRRQDPVGGHRLDDEVPEHGGEVVEPESVDDLGVGDDGGIGADERSDHGAVRVEKGLELKIGWSEPHPFEVQERGDPGAVPDDVVQVGVAVDDDARGPGGEGIEVSEPLELLAKPGDEVRIDVVEPAGPARAGAAPGRRGAG